MRPDGYSTAGKNVEFFPFKTEHIRYCKAEAMRFDLVSLFLVAIVCGSALAELLVNIKINGTMKCEAHKSCNGENDTMYIYNSWHPKGGWEEYHE